MKYSVFIASLVLVVFAKQSDAAVSPLNSGSRKGLETLQVIEQSSKENRDAGIYVRATELLRDSFIEGTNLIIRSEETIRNGIKAAEDIMEANPEAAKDTIRQACESAKMIASSSGPAFFESFGEALGLSFDGAKEGLEMGSHLVQEAGFAILESLEVVEDLADLGLDDGGRAAQVLIEAIKSAVETGYPGAFNNIQASIKTSQQALRNGSDTANEVDSQNCGAAANDVDGAIAVKAITEAANEALSRGANSELVVKFRDTVFCFLSELVTITSDGRNLLQSLRPLEGNQNAQADFARGSEAIRNAINDVAAKIYVLIGDTAEEAGTLGRSEVSAAISAVEEGKVQIILSIRQTAHLVAIGSRLRGGASAEAGNKSGLFGKVAFFQKITEGAESFLSVL